MRLIGLTGAAGCGKDTVAEYLAVKHSYHVIAFADPIYAAVSAAFGIPIVELKDRAKKEQVIPWIGRSPRQLLQFFGTEYGRDLVHTDIWLKIAENKCRQVEELSSLIEAEARVVLSDVRFENEADWVRAKGGKIWHMARPGTALSVLHASDRGLAKKSGDRFLSNNSDLESLYTQAGTLLLQGEA